MLVAILIVSSLTLVIFVLGGIGAALELTEKIAKTKAQNYSDLRDALRDADFYALIQEIKIRTKEGSTDGSFMSYEFRQLLSEVEAKE